MQKLCLEALAQAYRMANRDELRVGLRRKEKPKRSELHNSVRPCHAVVPCRLKYYAKLRDPETQSASAEGSVAPLKCK